MSDRIPVFHWQVALGEEIRAAQNARWAAEDEARRAAERDPRQDALRAAQALKRARPTRDTNPAQSGLVAPSTPRIRPVPAQPSERRDGTTLWVTAAELDYLSEALETHARYRSITDRRSIP